MVSSGGMFVTWLLNKNNVRITSPTSDLLEVPPTTTTNKEFKEQR